MSLPTVPFTAPASTPTQCWSLSREVVARVAGLPVEALEPLRAPASLRWAQDVLDQEDRVRDRAVTLSDALAEHIGTRHDRADDVRSSQLRTALLRLRRDVFNLRPPADPAVRRLAETLPSPLRLAVAAWSRELRRLETMRAGGRDLLAAEAQGSREHLRRLLADPRIRNGLLLASPALEAQLDGYLTASGTLSAKRVRKIERSAVSYVSRTATKPSPFSTFTGVALGRFTESGATAPAQVPTLGTSHVRVSVVALSRLFDAVLADAGRRRDLPVVPAPGWGRDHDRVRYVRRSVRAGDASATVTFDAARDQLFFLRRSDILEGLLGRMSAGPAPSFRELAGWLSHHLGEVTVADCEQYLATLLELGMLQVPVLSTSVHATDPLRAFRAALLELGQPWSRELAGRLLEPIRCIDGYAETGPTHRRGLLRALRRSLGEAMESLDGSAASLPSTLVYEDVRASDEPLLLDSAQWRATEAALRTLERLLPAFDQTLRDKQTLRAFFVARFGSGGRCEDLVRLVHDFAEDIYDEYTAYRGRTSRLDESGRLVADPNWLGSPVIAALDSARAAFADQLAASADAHPDRTEIELGPELVEAVASELDGVDPGFTALTHYLQRVAADGQELVVHNAVYGGFAFPFSRFTHCLDGQADGGLVERLRTRARSVTPPGAVLAEITGGFATSNLNLHAPLTDFEIVCPGEVSAARQEQRMDLADLVLEHDQRVDRLVLRSRRLGCEVVPVYLGYLVPQALPAISRTLLLLSPSTTLWVDPWAGVSTGGGTGADGTPLHRPRVRLGPLVLSRESWTVPVGSLPIAGGSETDPEQFLRWQRWRRRHAIPERVFARVQPAEPPSGVRRSKPHLVDFGSLLSLNAFRAMLTDPADSVELTEMLPDPGGLDVRSAAGSHVVELAVETVSHHRGVPVRDAAPMPTRRSA